MKNINKTAFANTTDWVEVTDADIVYEGALALPATLTTPQDVSIDFTKGFEYTGGDLVICMYDKTGVGVTSNWNQFEAGYNEAMALRTLYCHSDSAIDVNNISSVTGTTYAYTNYIKFTITANEGGETPEPDPTPEPELPENCMVAEFILADEGMPNKYDVDNWKFWVDGKVAVRFRQGSSGTEPKYYTEDQSVRMIQGGSTLEVMTNEHVDEVESKYLIKAIVITFASGQCYLSPDSGELSAEGDVRTWTGSAVNVKFTANGADKSHRAYVKAIKVYYE
jgi:hypothetical protein